MAFAEPRYSRAERIADACVHCLGVAASLAAMAVLVVLARRHLPAASAGSLTVYGISAVAMFAFSAAYNMIGRPHWKEVLRHCDHSAIFVMIAGTYTPLALITIGGIWGFALLASVWTIAIAGIGLKLLSPRRFDRISLGLYLVQGWAVLAAIGPLTSAVSTRVMALLAIGGALYTIGVVFHLWRGLPYQNAIWHLFVLSAAALHYVAIVDAVAPGFSQV
jgi:hemolysin III